MTIKNLISAIEIHFNAVVKYDDLCDGVATMIVIPDGFDYGIQFYVNHPWDVFGNLDINNIERSIYLVGCHVATHKMTPVEANFELDTDY